MTHLQLRKFLVALLAVTIVIAFIKLAMADRWYEFVIAFTSCVSLILTWAVTTDDRPSVKSDDDE
jgi:purine-cytosine permease-like protein